MRDLGYQPITEANLTVITTANLSRKASSAVQAWAILFKDFLETCFKITGMWLNDATKTEAEVHTDLAVDIEDARQMQALALFEAQGILSKETVFYELRRRGVISDDVTWEVNQEQLAGEQPPGSRPGSRGAGAIELRSRRRLSARAAARAVCACGVHARRRGTAPPAAGCAR